VGALYVLDEPSIGCTADTRSAGQNLHELRNLGNTILVVETRPEVMRASDLSWTWGRVRAKTAVV